MKRFISVLLIILLAVVPQLQLFASTETDDLTDIRLRPKNEKPMPGDDSLYYGYVYMDKDFSKDNLQYSAVVEYKVSNVRVEARTAGNVTVTGNKEYDLAVGTNNIQVVATKPDGTQKTYVITIYRKQDPNDDNNLKELWLQMHYGKGSKIKLTPEFSPEITEYNAKVDFDTDTVDLTYTTAWDVGGNIYKLKTGSNVINIPVTSKNGSKKVYSIDIYREKSSDNELKELSFYGIDVPKGANGKYSLNVSYDMDSAKIDVFSNSLAKVKIEGADKLKVGSNNYTITITAENGSSKIYYLTINRGKPSVQLDSLKLNEYTCGVDSNTYELDVKNSVDKLTISAKAFDYKSAKVTGNGTYKLKIGKNTFKLTVKAADGKTKTYNIMVNRSKEKKVVVKFYWVIE